MSPPSVSAVGLFSAVSWTSWTSALMHISNSPLRSSVRFACRRNGQIADLKREKEDLEATLYEEKEKNVNDLNERNAKFKEEKSLMEGTVTELRQKLDQLDDFKSKREAWIHQEVRILA